MKVEAEGPRIRIFVNDMSKAVVDVTDDRFAYGMVGVRDYCGDGDRSVSSFSKIIVAEK